MAIAITTGKLASILRARGDAAQALPVYREALALYEQDPARAEAFLTEYTHGLANTAVERYWRLGDELWVRFNNVF